MGNSVPKGQIPYFPYGKQHICYHKHPFQNTMMDLIPYKKRSLGERMILRFAERNNIPYLFEYKHSNLPTLRYDFVLLFKSRVYFIEFDGKQHFEYTPIFHTKSDDFYLSQQRDNLKTQLVKRLQSYIIRIDYTQMSSIDFHLNQALHHHHNKLYLSTPSMYSYLDEPLNPEVIKKYQVM